MAKKPGGKGWTMTPARKAYYASKKKVRARNNALGKTRASKIWQGSLYKAQAINAKYGFGGSKSSIAKLGPKGAKKQRNSMSKSDQRKMKIIMGTAKKSFRGKFGSFSARKK